MKKSIISFITVICFILSACITSFATDYSGHWAQNDIEYLLKEGIISGDSRGIRPEDNILRAEYIKIINRIFEIPDAHIKNPFSDLDEGKWYYNDIITAAAQGIIAGDENGNVNAEKFITRAEAAVVLARVMNLSGDSSHTEFSDNSAIPSWAVSSVNALAKAGIINGYADNSFRAGNNIKRAEAFKICVRSDDYSNTPAEKTETEVTIPVVSVGKDKGNSGSGGGGSGGGGGGNNSPVITALSAPVIKFVDTEDMTITWSEIDKATYYELILSVTTEGKSGEKTLNCSSAQTDISSAVSELIGNDRRQIEYFSAKVRAGNLQTVSSYSAAVEFYLYKDTDNTVAVPEIISNTEFSGDTEKITFEWQTVENASAYELYVDFGNGYVLVNNSQNNKVYITDYVSIDNLAQRYPVKFKVFSSDDEIADSETLETLAAVSLYGGKDGEYDIILNKRHFNNISANPSGKYLLKSDIDLGVHIPFAFSGTLIGDDETALRKIVLNVNMANGDAGLFTVISGSVNIQNIRLEGSVKGTVAGALAAQSNNLSDKSNSVLKNIENYADVTGDGTASSSYAGGIIGNGGESTNDYFNISYIENFGDVTGAYAGGIFGYMRGKASYIANHGNVTATRYSAGGIVANSYINLDACYNTGDVTGSASVGGIAGATNNNLMSISNSFNTGKITSDNSSESGTAAGILGVHTTNSSRKVYVYNCYNTGEIIVNSGSTSPAPIYFYNPSVALNAFGSNNYYISSLHSEDSDDTFDGTYPVEADYLKNISNLRKTEDGIERYFSESIWTVSDNGYEYPQIISLPYRIKPKTLSKPVISKVRNDENNNVTVTVNGDANSLSYTIEIFEDEESRGTVNLSGGTEASADITSLLNGFDKTYKISVTANGDGVVYYSNTAEPYEYLYVEYIAPPVGSGTDEDPYIISRTEHFTYISDLGMNKVYKIVCDLDFTGNNKSMFFVLGETEETAFSGKLIGDKNGEKPVITLDTESNGANGFVRYLNGGEINNFVLKGTVKGTKQIGSAVGLSKGGVVKNIDNYASLLSIIQTSESSVISAGGIVGAASTAELTVENCFNYADLNPHSYGTYIGGILGEIVKDTKVTVKSSGNYGDINGYSNTGGVVGYSNRATTEPVMILLSFNCGDVSCNVNTNNNEQAAKLNNNFGGVLGYGSAMIDQCFNTGKISGCDATGGIAGSIQYVSVNAGVTNSYNAGIIAPPHTTNTYKANAGIVGTASLNSSGTGKLIIKNNYNGGSVQFNRAHWAIIMGVYNATNIEIINNYYRSELTSSSLSAPSGFTETLPVSISPENMSVKSSFGGFDWDIWTIDENSSYSYPQLKLNTHKTKENN